jgi:ABC-2 type transport system permease protein
MSLMMGGVVGIATSIATLRERGVLKSLLLTPMKPANFFASQIIVRFSMALIQTAIMIALGIFVYGLHFSGSIFNLAIVVILGATVFLIFGLLMSGIAKSAETVEPMSRAITMPMIFLSGVFFPVDVMPSWLQPISKSMPLYYMADALRKVIAEGATLASIQTNIFVLLAWGVGGFAIALISFKWE